MCALLIIMKIRDWTAFLNLYILFICFKFFRLLLSKHQLWHSCHWSGVLSMSLRYCLYKHIVFIKDIATFHDIFLQPGKYQLWCSRHRLKFWISVWRFFVILANSNSVAADTDWNEVMAAARETINRQRQRPAKNGLVANCWQSKSKSKSLSVFVFTCNFLGFVFVVVFGFEWTCLRSWQNKVVVIFFIPKENESSRLQIETSC